MGDREEGKKGGTLPPPPPRLPMPFSAAATQASSPQIPVLELLDVSQVNRLRQFRIFTDSICLHAREKII